MMDSGSIRVGRLALGVAAGALALAACSQGSEDKGAAAPTTAATTATTAPTNAEAASAAAPAAASAPAADNTDTISGAKFASFTGDATKGATVFVQCKTCHEVTPGVNKIGPSLANVVGRKASTIAGYSYSPANHNSGITWTPEKLFQYLENPQRVVPGTKMAFGGIADPQKRADLIAYLAAN